MTVIELIQDLLNVIERDPYKAKVQVYAFLCDEEAAREKYDNLESPIPITSVDYDIRDRVELNI